MSSSAIPRHFAVQVLCIFHIFAQAAALVPVPAGAVPAPLFPTAVAAPLATCKGNEEEWKACTMPACDVCIPGKCFWQAWNEWSAVGGCAGLCIRTRQPGDADIASKCGIPCVGVSEETKTGCKVMGVTCSWDKPCEFGAWTEWDMKACQDDPMAQKTATRALTKLAVGTGKACTGARKETRPCTAPPVVVNCLLNPWREWTTCSKLCGGGHHTRTRRIFTQAQHGGTPCAGALMEQDHCNSLPCHTDQACVWALWGPWTGCDASSPTQRNRVRGIASPAYGTGVACSGEVKQIAACPHGNGQNCTIANWIAWHGCSKTCGGGQEFRSRHVISGGTHGKQCPSEELASTRSCNTQDCPNMFGGPVCQFSEWGLWSDCSQLCGAGINKRFRKVLGPLSEHHGCRGAIREIKACVGKANNCNNVIDCVWNDWSMWGGCTRTCGGGNKRRWRNVAVMPLGGGKWCDAKYKTEVAPCNTQNCNSLCIDGIWTEWGSWSTCRANKCDQGYRTRHRMEATVPNDCGRPAVGTTEDFQKCFGAGLSASGGADPSSSIICTRDCKFADWQPWTECSTSCYGITQRERQIAQYASGINGTSCVGQLRETVNCNPGPGAPTPEDCGGVWKRRDCKLSVWDPWSKCTENCDGGHQRRARIILQEPGPTGATCNSSLAQVQQCNKIACKESTRINCRWGQWSAWGACSLSGNAKFRRRFVEQMNNNLGIPCVTRNATEVATCISARTAPTFCIWQAWSAFTACPAGTGVTQCGPASQSRSRALIHVKTLALGLDHRNSSNYLSKGGNAAQCLGTQLDQRACSPFKPCDITCTMVPCIFNEWTDWGEGNCQGLCNRFRTVQQNAECGAMPCNGPLFETKVCPASCDKPQDCLLGDWEQWGNCMGTHSQTFRARPILQMPHNGGSNAACLGNISETKPCLEKCSPLDCKLTVWSLWTGCTKTCGTGWAVRKRYIVSPAMCGGLPCGSERPSLPGAATTGASTQELQPCNTQNCPIGAMNCIWGDWQGWSACRTDGQKYRERNIKQSAQESGVPCSGPSAELTPCLAKKCDISDWVGWSACDKSCDGGQQARHRQIHSLPRFGGDPCPLPLITWEIQGCNKDGCNPSLDCEVGPWSTWGGCTATCGYGQENRARTVINNRAHLGQGCINALAETRKCMPVACPNSKHCHYQTWSAWTNCSSLCGGGERQRERGFASMGKTGGAGCHATFTDGTPMAKGLVASGAPNYMKEVQSCNAQACTLGGASCEEAKWGVWSVWEPCQQRCGGAITWRSREKGASANSCGNDLSGSNREYKTCGTAPCLGDADCTFGPWVGWGSCTSPCNGVMRNWRHVTQHAQGRGKPCDGPLKVYSPCNPMPNEKWDTFCAARAKAVDCGWSPWTMQPCSQKCGGGVQHKTRSIMVPSKGDGKACNGTTTYVLSCNTQECTGGRDCVWGDWLEWGVCDSCGGVRKRLRKIKFAPRPGGKNCDPKDIQEVDGCSRHCQAGGKFCAWAPWTMWGLCSATCGNGKVSRVRQLMLSATQPRPAIPTDTALSQKFELLNLEMNSRRHSHNQELAFAFVGGLVSFLTLGAIVRAISRSRRTSAEPVYAPVGTHEPVPEALE